MDIGIALLMTQHDFNTISLAQKVEELGFESLWAPEHGIVPIDFKVAPATGQQGGIPKFYAEGGINQIIDPLLFLAGAATVTKKIKLGTGICLVPERNPIRLAKEVATLDRISNGRFLFGVGAGWLKGESEILGVDFPSRWKQTREYIDVMKELWTTDISEFHGKYIDFPPLICDPKPVQKPHPPLWSACGSEEWPRQSYSTPPTPENDTKKLIIAQDFNHTLAGQTSILKIVKSLSPRNININVALRVCVHKNKCLQPFRR